jgi:hypothetical protein
MALEYIAYFEKEVSIEDIETISSIHNFVKEDDFKGMQCLATQGASVSISRNVQKKLMGMHSNTYWEKIFAMELFFSIDKNGFYETGMEDMFHLLLHLYTASPGNFILYNLESNEIAKIARLEETLLLEEASDFWSPDVVPDLLSQIEKSGLKYKFETVTIEY